MTSNIGASLLDKGGSVGFGSGSSDNEERVLSEAKKTLGIEFINRIDEIILFEDFSLDNIKDMFNKEVSILKNKLMNLHGISLSIDGPAIDYLANKAYLDKMGARPVRKLMQQKVENIISKEIIKDTSKKIIIKKSDLT